MESPQIGFAFAAAIFWSLSSIVLGAAMRRVPRDVPRGNAAIAGLGMSLVSGLVCLGLVVWMRGEVLPEGHDKFLILGGVFTYPVATGLYYVCGYVLGERFEVAAQFANAKPIVSVGLGVVLLKESFSLASLVGIALIAGGLFVMSSVRSAEAKGWLGVGVGLATAAAWSLGEVSMKIGLSGATSLGSSFVALAWGTAIGIPAIATLLCRLGGVRLGSWAIGFMAHGVLSFCFAYSSFFEALRTSTLLSTVLVTAFWPGLALVLRRFVINDGIEPGRIHSMEWIAATLLLGGTLVHLVGAIG